MNSSAHKADVTLESREKLVQSLKAMNKTNKEMEQSRISFQMQMHEENLDFKHSKDKTKQEFQRLALLNQSMMVQAISNLAIVFFGNSAANTSPTPIELFIAMTL